PAPAAPAAPEIAAIGRMAVAPVVVEPEPAAAQPAPAPATAAPASAPAAGGRAGNDPRVNRRQVEVAVETQAVPLPFSQAPAAQPDPSRAGISRASNDPRHRRGGSDQSPAV